MDKERFLEFPDNSFARIVEISANEAMREGVSEIDFSRFDMNGPFSKNNLPPFKNEVELVTKGEYFGVFHRQLGLAVKILLEIKPEYSKELVVEIVERRSSNKPTFESLTIKRRDKVKNPLTDKIYLTYIDE